MIQILYLLLSTSMFFSVTPLFLFLSPFKHLLYFHLFISPFLSLSLCTSLLSILSPSLSLFVPMFVYFSHYLHFFFLLSISPFVTLSAIVSSTLIHYLFLCVSLTSIDFIFPFLFVYTTFLSPSHVHSLSMFVFSFSFSFSISVIFFLSLLLWSVASQ